MSCPAIGATTQITNGVTSVDCQKHVRSWRLLRSIMELLIPSCYCTFIEDQEIKQDCLHSYYPKHFYNSSSVIAGTVFGYLRGKVSFCIQANSKSTNPILLLEFAVLTAVLAREMQGDILRIALDCSSSRNKGNSDSVLSMPAWTMYCNGWKVGYAVKRRPSKANMDALRQMSSDVVGAGMITGKELDRDYELMYLRANFERVCGSSDSESFHLIDPERNVGQEFSIFFFRSQ
ncbi:protein MIZU-KUSSEI 1-like [Durio zibethinus]|uniref:Protein MIZU-KUSSEI 1-like n=1 Tax=Durio zibethinus TaxID=66656 RepID=A0A6P5ZI51_DURZI|nr:protein MIZU-KUSSEI 1-like [Durio zibethinus]